MNCCNHACNEGRDCPEHFLTNTHRVVVPFNTGKVQIGRAYTPRVTPQQANCIEYEAAPSLVSRPWFWAGAVVSLLAWWLIYAVVTA